MTSGQAAAIAAFATFAGGTLAGLAGQNAAAGALAAQNEAMNNCLGHPESCTQMLKNAGSSFVTSIGVPSTFLQVMAMLSMNADIGGTAGEEEGLIEGAESAFAAEEAGTLANAAVGTNSAAIQTYWPPSSGFFTDPVNQTLETGTLVSRYGGFYDASGNFVDCGNFVAPADVPYGMRALPPGTDASKPLSVYQVVTPIQNVPTGPASPWFGELGLVTQHQLPSTIQDYLDSGAPATN